MTTLLGALLLVVMFIGLRDDVGSDWGNYSTYYYSSLENKMSSIKEHLFNYLTHLFSNSNIIFNYFVFVNVLFSMSLLLLVASKYKSVNLIIFLYVSLYLLSLMGLMRQAISVSLCIYAGEKLFNKKVFQYFIYLFIATMLHYPAILFFAVYFVFKNIMQSYRKYLIIIFIAILFNIYWFSSSLPMFISKYTIYANYNQGGVPFLPNSFVEIIPMLFKRVMLLIIFTYYYFRYPLYSIESFYYRIYLLSVPMLVCFYYTIPALAVRGGLYFSIYEIFLLSFIYKINNQNLLVKSLIVFYGFIYFTNVLYKSDVLLPYQSFLF